MFYNYMQTIERKTRIMTAKTVKRRHSHFIGYLVALSIWHNEVSRTPQILM